MLYIYLVAIDYCILLIPELDVFRQIYLIFQLFKSLNYLLMTIFLLFFQIFKAQKFYLGLQTEEFCSNFLFTTFTTAI